MKPPLKLAIVISGRGSNMLAIAKACAEGRIAVRVVRVIADRAAAGIAAAQALGLDTTVIDARAIGERAAFEAALADGIERSGADLVALAGFMRILSPEFTARFEGRLLNIHPSLLPDYKGLHTHRRVLEAGERTHGATVHFVTRELDGGPPIAQVRVPISGNDTESSLSARVQQQEHIIYVQVIGWIAAGKLQWRNGAPLLDGAPLLAPVAIGAESNAKAQHA